VINSPPPVLGGVFLGIIMTDLVVLKAANESRWAHAKVTRGPAFSVVAKGLVSASARSRYRAVAACTGVPWYIIAVIHERECSQDWHGSLAQGDPWDRVSVHVPAGRGPFRSWEEAAIDALVNCAPHAARNKDWSIGGALTLLEQYNGLGYAARGKPSPYIWSGTNQYQSGKFVRDGVYDPEAVDGQLGCAGLLLSMMALDPNIEFSSKDHSAATLTPTPHPPPASIPNQSQPSITNPSKGSIGAFIATLIAAIFRRN
jgi:lysozyme family protein